MHTARTSSALRLPQRRSSARGLTGEVLLITKLVAVLVISPVARQGKIGKINTNLKWTTDRQWKKAEAAQRFCQATWCQRSTSAGWSARAPGRGEALTGPGDCDTPNLKTQNRVAPGSSNLVNVDGPMESCMHLLLPRSFSEPALAVQCTKNTLAIKSKS